MPLSVISVIIQKDYYGLSEILEMGTRPVFIEKKEEGDENTNFFNLNSYFFNYCKLT